MQPHTQMKYLQLGYNTFDSNQVFDLNSKVGMACIRWRQYWLTSNDMHGQQCCSQSFGKKSSTWIQFSPPMLQLVPCTNYVPVNYFITDHTPQSRLPEGMLRWNHVKVHEWKSLQTSMISVAVGKKTQLVRLSLIIS